MTKRKKALRSPEDVIISQRACQALMSNQEVLAAFEEVEDGYLQGWANTTPQEKDKREVAYFAFKAVKDVRAVLARKAASAQVRDLKEKPNG